jgi:hypothetical protein
MPTLLRQNGFRFFFYSNENNEPIHVRVNKADANGKIWLEPSIAVEYLIGFSNSEEREIREIVAANVNNFKNKWNEYFGQ